MEYNAQTEMSTVDFSKMFSGEMNFADEAPLAAENIKDDMDGFKQSVLNEDTYEYEDVDYENQFETNPLFDDEEATPESAVDLLGGNDLPEYINYNGSQLMREDVEKALVAHGKINEFATEVQNHFAELDAFEENLNQLNYLATSEISEYIDHYQSVLDNPRIDAQTRTEAYTEIQRYKGQRAAIENQYKASSQQLQERKAQAGRLKGKAVYNQLSNAGWKDNDFQNVASYMEANSIVIPFGAVDSNVMIALKKAAMYDNKIKEDKGVLETNVQRAIAGKPARTSKPVITPDDSRRRAKAEQMLRDGTLSTNDMFDMLSD